MGTTPETVRIGKQGDQLTKKQKKAIRNVFLDAEGKLEDEIREENEPTMGGRLKGKLKNKRTIVLGRLARVSYSREEKGSLAWQGPGNTYYESDKVVKSRMKITFGDGSEGEGQKGDRDAEVSIDFNRKPVSEALRLIGALSVNGGAPVELDQGVELVCQMVQEATASVT